MRFVWSDDLALLLADEGEANAGRLGHWITSPIGYRLSENEDPLSLARRLLHEENATANESHAS